MQRAEVTTDRADGYATWVVVLLFNADNMEARTAIHLVRTRYYIEAPAAERMALQECKPDGAVAAHAFRSDHLIPTDDKQVKSQTQEW